MQVCNTISPRSSQFYMLSYIFSNIFSKKRVHNFTCFHEPDSAGSRGGDKRMRLKYVSVKHKYKQRHKEGVNEIILRT